MNTELVQSSQYECFTLSFENVQLYSWEEVIPRFENQHMYLEQHVTKTDQAQEQVLVLHIEPDLRLDSMEQMYAEVFQTKLIREDYLKQNWLQSKHPQRFLFPKRDRTLGLFPSTES